MRTNPTQHRSAENLSATALLGNEETLVNPYQKSGTFRSLREALDLRSNSTPSRTNQSGKRLEKRVKSAKQEGYELRAAMRQPIWGSKMALCGFAADNGLVAVEATSEGSSRLAGGQKCKKSLCPCCGFEKDTKRAEEIKTLFQEGANEGWSGWFATLTFSHKNRESVKSIGDDLQQCWRRTYQSLRRFTEKQYGFQLEFENILVCMCC